MKHINVNAKIKHILEPKKDRIKARLFVTREDGITIYDSVQNQTTSSVSALVSGVWQASEALMGMVHDNSDILEFRLGFDTSSQGIYLFPFDLLEKRYFLGAIYHNCVNPGQLKRQITLIKEEMVLLFQEESKKQPIKKNTKKNTGRDGFLFNEITDAEIDRIFSVGGI